MQDLVTLVLSDLERKPATIVGADGQYTCLEVGCGSGAISLSLLKSLPQVRFLLVERNTFCQFTIYITFIQNENLLNCWIKFHEAGTDIRSPHRENLAWWDFSPNSTYRPMNTLTLSLLECSCRIYLPGELPLELIVSEDRITFILPIGTEK